MSDLNLNFRLAKVTDLKTLTNIYRQSIHQTANKLYNQHQVEAWSAFADNFNNFCDYIFNPQTYVLEKDSKIIAFCGLEMNGHIASFYVHPDHNRQGYGSKILNYVLNIGEESGIKRFFAEASFLSQPVFSRAGFEVIGIETVKYEDVFFDRYQMEKLINN